MLGLRYTFPSRVHMPSSITGDASGEDGSSPSVVYVVATKPVPSYMGVAQLEVRLPWGQDAVGSSPTAHTN